MLTKSELWAHSDHVTMREGKQKVLGTGEGVVWLCLWVLRPLVGKEVCEWGAELSSARVCEVPGTHRGHIPEAALHLDLKLRTL